MRFIPTLCWTTAWASCSSLRPGCLALRTCVYLPHLILGIAEIAAAMTTQTVPSDARPDAGHRVS